MVNHTFNGMMEQIQELRIHVYEEQLNKQKAELQHLQLQINPHFFMNSLNIIYNLALVKNYALIQEMAISLVQYFRYMFRSNLTFLPLKDELQHIRNYIRIQELRFLDSAGFRNISSRIFVKRANTAACYSDFRRELDLSMLYHRKDPSRLPFESILTTTAKHR